MGNEMNVYERALLNVDDHATELELLTEKVRYMLCDVTNYLTDMDSEYFEFYRKENEVKARIAFDYVCELEDAIKVLQEYVLEMRRKNENVERKCA